MANEKPRETAPVAAESTYTPEEIASVAEVRFGYSQDIALAALTINGRRMYTLNEAKPIIKSFAERKVN
ncbi:MAG: hypothetical protein RR482_00920 [Clostridia bacterium]